MEHTLAVNYIIGNSIAVCKVIRKVILGGLYKMPIWARGTWMKASRSETKPENDKRKNSDLDHVIIKLN